MVLMHLSQDRTRELTLVAGTHDAPGLLDMVLLLSLQQCMPSYDSFTILSP